MERGKEIKVRGSFVLWYLFLTLPKGCKWWKGAQEVPISIGKLLLWSTCKAFQACDQDQLSKLFCSVRFNNTRETTPSGAKSSMDKMCPIWFTTSLGAKPFHNHLIQPLLHVLAAQCFHLSVVMQTKIPPSPCIWAAPLIQTSESQHAACMLKVGTSRPHLLQSWLSALQIFTSILEDRKQQLLNSKSPCTTRQGSVRVEPWLLHMLAESGQKKANKNWGKQGMRSLIFCLIPHSHQIEFLASLCSASSSLTPLLK